MESVLSNFTTRFEVKNSEMIASQKDKVWSIKWKAILITYLLFLITENWKLKTKKYEKDYCIADAGRDGDYAGGSQEEK